MNSFYSGVLRGRGIHIPCVIFAPPHPGFLSVSQFNKFRLTAHIPIFYNPFNFTTIGATDDILLYLGNFKGVETLNEAEVGF